MKRRNHKYIVVREEDVRCGEVGDLIDSFTRPDNMKMMYTLQFYDRELRGYYYEEIEPIVKAIK